MTKDIFDNEVNIGDRLAIAFVSGRSGYLRIGRVMELVDTDAKILWEADNKLSPWVNLKWSPRILKIEG